MKYLKFALKPYIYISLILVFGTLLITTLSYLDFINYKISNILKLLITLISLFVGGFIVGKKNSNKGWLAGLKLGSVFVIILLLFNYTLIRQNLKLISFPYYLSLMIASSIGGMIGINKKKND